MDKFIELAYAESKSEKYKLEQIDSLSFARGAQWANEQNAAEIAELRNVLLSVLEADIAHNLKTGDFALPKSLRDQAFAVLEKYGK